MSQNLTTLETVFNRVDAMAANHFDHFVRADKLNDVVTATISGG